MFVVAHWMERELAVPLIQIEGGEVDASDEEAIEHWHYWRVRGYEFG